MTMKVFPQFLPYDNRLPPYGLAEQIIIWCSDGRSYLGHLRSIAP